jgi:hypothetical protein
MCQNPMQSRHVAISTEKYDKACKDGGVINKPKSQIQAL